MKRFYAAAIIGIFSFGACGPLRAGPTAYVATNGAHVYPYDTWATAASNLQAAVDAVDLGGTVWVTNGVYASGGAEVYGMSNRVALTRSVTLQSVNGPDVTFIQGQGPLGDGAVRCAYLTNGAALVGFTLTNGFTREWVEEASEPCGGGAYLDCGGTVSNCTVCGNEAIWGGGVACYNGGALLNSRVSGNRADSGGGVFIDFFDHAGSVSGCTINGNSAYSGGGGLFCYGGVVSDCLVSENSAVSEGGGILCGSEYECEGEISNCTISSNTAGSGGGVACAGRWTVSGCLVSDNRAGSGGGVKCWYGGTVMNCVVSGNEAGGGGGVDCYDGEVSGCLICGNRTDGAGGGVCLNDGLISNCTIGGNEAQFGGGVSTFEGGILVNSIIYANVGVCMWGSLNIDDADMKSQLSHCCTDVWWGTDTLAADPLFVDAAAGDFRLQANSPCNDAGTNQTWMAGATDLDGKPRVLNETVDIGAYESGFTVTASAGPNGSVSPSGTVFVAEGQSLTVTVTSDADCYFADVLVDGLSMGPSAAPFLSYTFSNDSACHTISATILPLPAVTFASTNGASLFPYDTWEKAAAVIQTAVDALRSSGGTVWVSNGVYAAGGAEVYGMSNRVALTRSVTLQSVNGPDATFICGQGPLGASAVRCAYVTNGAALIGFTLTNGFTRTSGDGALERSGGGAWLDCGGTVSNCAVCGNSAALEGAGVFFYYGGTVSRSAISGNASKYGGGGSFSFGGTAQDCTISGNSATYGGGIYSTGDATLEGCLIARNNADLGGGAFLDGTATVANCTVGANIADWCGGCLHCGGGSYFNTIFYSNTGGSTPDVFTSDPEVNFTACCTDFVLEGEGNIAADPLFVNVAADDFRLQPTSPCIDAGINEVWMSGATDLDSKPRLLNGIVDLGAYEADCTVTVTTGPNGSGSPSGTVFVTQGQTLTVCVTPDADYFVADVLVDGQSQGPSSSLSYTFSDVTNSHTVSAAFLPCPAVTYVSTNGASLYPYDTWEKATAVIQSAVDALRSSGGAVWASNGVYAAGGAAVHGMSNRVALTRAVTLQSVNGPDVTFIQGQGPLGDGAVRCAYVTNGASLSGFTLADGFTRTSGDACHEQSGGGVWLDRGGEVSGCAVSGCAAVSGGGVFCYQGGAARNCAVSGNAAASDGGGVYCDRGGTAQNCTVGGNAASRYGGGVYCNDGGSLANTIVFGNTGSGSSNVHTAGTGMRFTSCLTDPAMEGTGNIAADPLFVDVAAGDFRLQAVSPCLDAGLNEAWMSGATDLDGKPRVLNGTVDMGAYEADCTVTVTAGPNDSVSPSGTVFVAQGQALTVCVTPDADYYSADVLMDGLSMGTSPAQFVNYNFSNVTNSHTLSAFFLIRPTTTYVSTNGGSLYPYDTWEKAAFAIQDAADYVRPGGTVWVSNGVYAAGGATVCGSNRVALTRPVTLQSVNGPDAAFIFGQGPLGAGAVRCAYLTNGAALVGFTLANGFTLTSNDESAVCCGGGAYLDGGGTVSNCTINGNMAAIGGGTFLNYGGTLLDCRVDCNSAVSGGGVLCLRGGTVQNSTVSGNLASDSAGGIMFLGGGTVLNSTVSGNSSSGYGGGIYCYVNGTIKNCTVSANTSPDYGGGIYWNGGGTILNCTVSGNAASQNGGFYSASHTPYMKNTIIYDNMGGSASNVFFKETDGRGVIHCCTFPSVAGTGNIAADPLFVNAATGDYRLQTNSPCLNAGTNQTGMVGMTDLDGRPRVIHGIVDIGAYEALLPGWDEDADGLPDEWEWNQASTLTGLAPDADADGDGADNLAEYGADTDPLSCSSLLTLTSIAPEAGGVRVAWRGGQDAWQYLERSTNLSAGAADWTAVYTNAPPTASAIDVLDLPPAGPASFYRVRAHR